MLVSYTDPFGLSPQSNITNILGHTFLHLAGMIPIAGAAFEIANAVWYGKEHNAEMAILCVTSALPAAGELIGAANTTITLGKFSVSTVNVGKTLKIAGYSGIFTGGVCATAETGTIMYKEYVVEKQKFGWNTVWETASLTLGLITIGTSGYALKSTISSPKSIVTEQPLKEGNTAKERLSGNTEINTPEAVEETVVSHQTKGSTAGETSNTNILKTDKVTDVSEIAKEAEKIKTAEVGDGVGGKYSYDRSSSNVSQFLCDRPELTGTNREKLLSIVQDPALKRFVDQVYRPGATVGDGGTSDKLIAEFYEGNSRHLPKAKERLNGINRIINSGNLGLNDLDLAEALRDDLENAIKLFE